VVKHVFAVQASGGGGGGAAGVVIIKPITASTGYISTYNGTAWVENTAIAVNLVEANGNALPLNKRVMAIQSGAFYLVTLDTGVVTDVKCSDGVLNVTRRT
jgi:hypothetical protein